MNNLFTYFYPLGKEWIKKKKGKGKPKPRTFDRSEMGHKSGDKYQNQGGGGEPGDMEMIQAMLAAKKLELEQKQNEECKDVASSSDQKNIQASDNASGNCCN